MVCVQALFGNPDYEDMYEGFMVYAGNGQWVANTPSLSDPRYGCGTYDITTNPAWWALYQDISVNSIILMVDRNPDAGTNCTFSEKVYSAQLAAAKVSAVLIVDTRLLTPWPTYMRADARSRQVELPSLFVPQEYGDVIRNAAIASSSAALAKAIRVELEFYVPNPDDRVEYDLYFNMLNQKSLPFLTTWGNIARVLKQRAFFTPHWYVLDGTTQCKSPPQWGDCSTNCLQTSSKWYCLYSADNSKSTLNGVTGSQALQEVLRQQCIFNALSTQPNSTCPSFPAGTPSCNGYNNYWAWIFWSYLDQFYSNCVSSSLDPNYRFSAQCSMNALASVNSLRPTYGQPSIDPTSITTCADWQTIGNANSGSIPALDNMIATWEATGPLIEPFLYVNMFPYSGDITCKTPINEDTCGILSMMCYGYANDTRYPVECTYPSNCPFGTPNCNGQVVTTTEKSGISAGAVVGIVLAFLFIAGVVGYYFHKRSQDRTRAEVDALLKQYLPMDPGATHGVAQGAQSLRAQHEKRLIQDMDLEDQELETTDEV